MSKVVTYSLRRDGETRVANNFKVKEFRCKDGSDKILICPETVTILQAIRDYFGKPVTINSAYRTPTYNKKIGGASRSQHMVGTACDIKVAGVPPTAIAGYIEANFPNHGVGLYPTFVHVDSRGYKTYWTNGGSKVVKTFGQGNAYTKYKAVATAPKAQTAPVQSQPQTTQLRGIDLSSHQLDIDADKVAKQVAFAILRVGYGVSYSINQKDKYFESYYNGLHGKVPVGAYYYSYAKNIGDGKKEAENCLKYLGGKSLELPIFYDVEDKSMNNVNAVAREFVDAIKKAGYRPGIYCSSSWAKSRIDLSKFSDCMIWIANYGKNDGVPHTKPSNCDIWQYTSVGKVDGVKGNVDMSIAYTKLTDDKKEEEIDMTKAEVQKMIDDAVKKALNGANTQVSDWAVDEYAEARKLGITDGTRPGGYATREQVALMVLRGMKLE